MTYLALARKWRPKNFTEVMGQTHVVKALSNALSSGRVHHAFLFTGTRGVGKTTLARIFAKSLNCEQGMTATPCGECSVCVNVDQGNFIDLIEVDAASRTGIDDMRELLDNIQYAPTQGRYKVYLIDEIHMLSKSSFNALLKTLEEPPEHIKFLFATTDPQKLPVTVLSRCLQFNLKALQPDEITQQLSHILTSEEIQFDDSGIQLISRAADGSLRDALSLLEQGIAQGGGSVDAESIRAMLGTVKATHMDELVQAIIRSDAEQALSTVNDMATYSADFNAAINQLLIEMHTIALAHIAADTLNYKVADVEKYLDYAAQISAEDVQLCYQIALMAKRDIALAPDYRSGFEMAVLRIIAFKPVDKAQNQSVRADKPIASASESSIEGNDHTSKPSKTVSETVINATQDVQNPETLPEEQLQAQTIQQAQTETINIPISESISLPQNPAIHGDIAPSMSYSAEFVQKPTNEPTFQSAVDSNNSIHLEDEHRRAPSKPQINSSNNQADSNINQAPQLPTDAFNAAVTSKAAPTIAEKNIPIMDQGRVVPEFDQPFNHSPNQPISQPTYQQEQVETQPQVAVTQAMHDIDADDEDPTAGLPQAPHNEWAGFVEQLQLNGLVRELAMNMACANIQVEPMHLSLDPNFQYMKNALREEAIIEEIRKLRGTNYQINIVVESTVHETPAERIKRLSEERDQNTLQQLKDDPKVQSVMHAFDMKIDESSVKPK